MDAQRIYVDEDEKGELITFYELQLAKINDKRNRILKNLELLKGTKEPVIVTANTDSGRSVTSGGINSSSSYPFNEKWEKRIVFVLEELNRPSQKSTIYDIMVSYEPELNNNKK